MQYIVEVALTIDCATARPYSSAFAAGRKQWGSTSSSEFTSQGKASMCELLKYSISYRLLTGAQNGRTPLVPMPVARVRAACMLLICVFTFVTPTL